MLSKLRDEMLGEAIQAGQSACILSRLGYVDEVRQMRERQAMFLTAANAVVGLGPVD